MAKLIPPRSGKRRQHHRMKDNLTESDSGQSGLIICNYGQTLDVEDQSGQVHRCTMRRKIGALVCGDMVFWIPSSGDEGVIVASQPRQTLLVRPDSNGALKPVAANVDQLLVGIAPRLSGESGHVYEEELLVDTALIDRYLVAAELSRIHAIIVINKIDLLAPEALSRIRLYMEIYQDIGYEVLFTTTKQPSGTDELIAAFNEHVSVFCGPSGVGKSSLVKAVLPDQDIRIGAF